MTLEPQDKLVVWTVQPATVWEQVQARGTLTVDSRYSGDLHHCYEWLRGRLQRLIPGYAGNYPWWAYCTRPDLRAVRHQQARGELYYLIELALPRQHAVDFPFWAWDMIFSCQYLSYEQQESETWHRRAQAAAPDSCDRWPRPDPWLSELETSWDRLFDPELPNRGWLETSASYSEREAVFEVLDLSHVSRVTRFLGSNAKASRRTILSWYHDQSEPTRQ